MIEIIDDFLTMEDAHFLKEQLCGNNFPWFYQNDREKEGDGNYQFTHVWQDGWLYKENGGWNSSLTHHVDKILYKLNPKILWRLKVNLQPPVETIEPCEFHTDPPEILPHITTGIYYVTAGGYTEFETGEKVDSIENRLVLFPSNIAHRGSTNTSARVVINLNYEPHETVH